MKATITTIALVVLFAAAGLAFWIGRPDTHHLLITEVVATPADGDTGTVAVTLTIDNRGGPDRLTGVGSEEAAAARLHAPDARDGVPVPGQSAPSLALDGAHVVLEGISGALDDGRLIPLTLTFENAGPVSLRARLKRADAMAMAHGSAHSGMTMEGTTMEDTTMGGAPLSIPAGEAGPALSLSVTPLPDGAGWRVTAVTENFTFDREQADGPHQPGHGHGHLYVGSLKVQRLYQPEAVIGPLPAGTHLVRVTLNTNDHRLYAVDGRPVTATVPITVD